MSFHVANIKNKNEVWELLSEDGHLAMLVATFSNEEDARLFADLKNGYYRPPAEDRNFVFTDCSFVDDVPEASSDDVVLVEEDFIDAEFTIHPPEDEDAFYSTLELLQMSDEQFGAYLNGADIEEVKQVHADGPHYCEAGTPIGTPTTPEHGDFL